MIELAIAVKDSDSQFRAPKTTLEQPVTPINFAERHKDLERAKRGMQEFKFILNLASPAARSAMLFSRCGQYVQAMILGLKPVSSLDDDASYSSRQEMINLLRDKFTYRKRLGLYNPDLVKDTLEENPEIFPGFNKGQNAGMYLESLFFRKQLNDKRLGILYGFPKPAVLDYASNMSIWDRLRILANWNLSQEERTLVYKYYCVYDEDNSFKQTHQAEIKNHLSRLLPDLTEEKKACITSRRLVKLPGFSYVIYRPSRENTEFEHKVKFIFEASGMNQLITSCRGTESALAGR